MEGENNSLRTYTMTWWGLPCEMLEQQQRLGQEFAHVRDDFGLLSPAGHFNSRQRWWCLNFTSAEDQGSCYVSKRVL